MAEQKTNVMRLLEQKKVKYSAHQYAHCDDAVDGVTAARLIGMKPEKVFKTLVARAPGGVYVFVIPVAAELELKKAAKSVGEKSVAMVHISEINALTGYIRGGCSPLGMKKQYVTVFHSSALSLETVVVSAGKIGFQVELGPGELIRLCRGKTADIVCE